MAGMRVIAVTGSNGSGKDVLAEHLARRCDTPVFSLGDAVREIAEEEGVDRTRENLHEISRQCFAERGRDVFVRRIIEQAEQAQANAVVISGVRTPAEVRTLRRRFGRRFLLAAVRVSDPQTRFERLRRRNDPRDPDTREEFDRQERTEEELFGLRQTQDMADLEIRNDGPLEDFHRAIDRLIDKVTGYMRVDRPQRTSSLPPSLYGFVPRTYCAERVAKLSDDAERGDGDPLDICVVSERPVSRSEVILNAKVIGVIQCIDDEDADDKIIGVLENDPFWSYAEDLSDIPDVLVQRLRHYFSTYKNLPRKPSRMDIRQIAGRDRAMAVVKAAMDDYQEYYRLIDERTAATTEARP